jgi:hypothetical protein
MDVIAIAYADMPEGVIPMPFHAEDPARPYELFAKRSVRHVCSALEWI